MGGCLERDGSEATDSNGCASQNVLHVVSVVNAHGNAAGWSKKGYDEWRDVMRRTPRVRLYTVEVLFEGDAGGFQVTGQGNVSEREIEVQVKAPHKVWLKENLINVAVASHFPKNWRYMAWVDPGVRFSSTTWAKRALNALQSNPVIQLYETVHFLEASGRTAARGKSFAYYSQRAVAPHASLLCDSPPYPGIAWAMHREAYDLLQGLPEYSITGTFEAHLAYGLTGNVTDSIPKDARRYLSASYFDLLKSLQTTLHNMQIIHRPAPVIDGPGYLQNELIECRYEGDPTWQHASRYRPLARDGRGYNPKIDVSRNAEGVLVLSKPALAFLDGVAGCLRAEGDCRAAAYWGPARGPRGRRKKARGEPPRGSGSDADCDRSSEGEDGTRRAGHESTGSSDFAVCPTPSSSKTESGSRDFLHCSFNHRAAHFPDDG
ncbi:hypothetical protein DIPPA_12656 [Diplonema papillatum]|nr:hypothetical protein DIPPA_12656 [Diplonema papillatum]